MNQELIGKLIPWNYTWSSVEGGIARIPLRFNDGETIVIPDSDLAEIHEDLPAAIRILETKEDIVDSRHIIAMLSIWNRSIYLENHNGDMYAVDGIDNISVKNNLVVVKCYGHPYTVEVIPKSGKNVFIPIGYDPSSVLTKKTWLNTNHPGWEERLQLSRSLDLNPIDTLRFMLSPKDKPQCNVLPDDLGFS